MKSDSYKICILKTKWQVAYAVYLTADFTVHIGASWKSLNTKDLLVEMVIGVRNL